MISRFWKWLTDPAQRTRAALILLGAAAAAVVFTGVVYAWEYTSQPVFCGTTCHTMPPEYNAYEESAHARVYCVTCHVSRGVNTAVAEKITDMRHVILFTFKSYETPIVIKSLRPAREACENCHWPEKFHADRVDKIVHYLPDSANTELDTYLIMKTGGGTGRSGQDYGIHWHVQNKVEFVATDNFNQVIPWVRATMPDGSVVEYFDDDSKVSKAEVTQLTKQTMECVDCHNRTAHRIKSPDTLVDEAIASGLIDRSLPEIKLKAVEALSAPAETRGKAVTALDGFYSSKYSSVYAGKKQAVADVVKLLAELDVETGFPDLQVNYKTYPDNTGHKDFPGCFRCHDGKHIAQSANVAPERSSIRLQCNVCHTIPETVIAGQRPAFTAVVPAVEPAYHTRGDWMARHPRQVDATCAACHGEIKYSAKPTVANQSFCANINCHGAGWSKYISLVESPASGQPPLPTPATPVPARPGATPSPAGGLPPLPADHVGRAADSCLLCHGPAAIRPVPASHAGRTVETCLTCHRASTPAPTAPAGSPSPVPTKPAAATPSPTKTGGSAIPGLPADHAGRTAEICLACHGPAGIQPAPASHAGRTADTCLACHKPAAAAPGPTTAPSDATPAPATGVADPLPADHAGRPAETCLVCHGPAGVKPVPPSHTGRAAETCLACHK